MREISKISRGLGIGYDPIQGTSRHAECPAYFFCHLAQRLQARGVRGEGSYQYSIFRSRYHLQQTCVDVTLRSAFFGVEDVGAVTHKRQHALITDSCQVFGRRSEEHTSELQSLMRISY